MHAPLRRSVAAFALVIAAGACGSESSVAPLREPGITLVDVFGEFAGWGTSDAFEPVAYGASEPEEYRFGGCTYAAATQSFDCKALSAGGLTFTPSYTLLDAGGIPQSAFDASKTDVVRTVTLISGKQRGIGADVTITGRQEASMSGLLAGTHTLRAHSVVRSVGSSTIDGVSYPLDVKATSTAVDLVRPRSITATGGNWPVSGTVTLELDMLVGSLPRRTSSRSMTFSGTSTVALVTVEGGITRHCTFDLSSVKAPACH